MKIQMVLVALVVAASPIASAAAPTISAAADPVRLAAAREAVELAFPPAIVAAMVDRNVQAFTPLMRQAFLRDPELKSLAAADPRIKLIVDRYFGNIQARVTESIRESHPAVIAAMASAFARRFTPAQLAELKAFLITPTGRLFVGQSATLPTDPDVDAAQGAMLIALANAMESDKRAERAEINAVPPLNPKMRAQ